MRLNRKIAMSLLRSRINPQTFVITLRQLAKHLNIDSRRILNWEKWQHLLWVHIEGRGGYFVSYRTLEQWITACCALLRCCPNLEALAVLWSAIQKEAKRYTEEGLEQLQQVWQQRQVCMKMTGKMSYKEVKAV